MFVLWFFASLAPVYAEKPDFNSGNGITVVKSAWLEGSERTVIVDIETPLISPKAINGDVHQVWITLPETYFSSTTTKTRYPVLYLLHGGAGGWAGQWVVGGGTAERSTRNYDLITVMPDGGKVGWFTDWVNDGGKAQEWETFHLTQLIPWIDANLRTAPDAAASQVATVENVDLPIVGRTADNIWLQVEWQGNTVWVSRAYVSRIEGDLTSVPVTGP